MTTGFGVELSASERKPRNAVPSTSLCEPFREAIELGLSQGRNSIRIWQDIDGAVIVGFDSAKIDMRAVDRTPWVSSQGRQDDLS